MKKSVLGKIEASLSVKSFYMNYTVYDKRFKEGFLATRKTLIKDAYCNLLTKSGKKLAKEKVKELNDFFDNIEK